MDQVLTRISVTELDLPLVSILIILFDCLSHEKEWKHITLNVTAEIKNNNEPPFDSSDWFEIKIGL